MHGRVVGAVILGALFSTIASQAVADDRMKISLSLAHDGTTFAKSNLLIVPGVQRTVSIPEEQLSVALVVTDCGDGLVKIVARVTSAYGDMQPTLTTRFGREASISNGSIEMNVTASKNWALRQEPVAMRAL